jgi:zinc transporter
MQSFRHCYTFNDKKWHEADKLAELKVPRYWVHMQRDQEAHQILEHFDVPDTVLTALFEETTRPKYREIDHDSTLVVVRALNLNPQCEPDDMVSLRILFDSERLLTVRNRPVQAVIETIEQMKKGKLACETPIEVVMVILTNIVKRLEDYVDKLSERLDHIEDAVVLDDNHDLSELNSLRRTVSRFCRHLFPQQDAFRKLALTSHVQNDPEKLHQLHGIADSMTIMVEELAFIRERCEILVQDIDARVQTQSNNNLYVLSILSAIFLPISFLTGLFGINVGGMPWVESEIGFMILCASCLVIVGFEIWLFKRKKWI